jgi:hypothetical protein
VFPALCAPLACASAVSSAAGQGIPLALAGPLAALALVVSGLCWVEVVALWRALPRGGDEDQGWWRRRGGEGPRDPGGSGGGISFDWVAFERQFWSHVAHVERERERARELIHACATS